MSVSKIIIFIPDGFDVPVEDRDGDTMDISDISGTTRCLTFRVKVKKRHLRLDFEEDKVRHIRDLLTEWLDAPSAHAEETP